MLGNQISLTNNVAKQVVSVTATQNQTDFTVQGGYRINQLGVYRNGVRLVDGRDFLARNGATVTLLSQGANAGDAMEFVVFDDFRVADALSVNAGGTVNASVNITGALQMGTGTSIFSPADNVLTFGTNSAERVRIDSDGDVVVNDTTAAGNVHPDTKLHVKGGITFRQLTSASENALPAITQWSSSGTGQDLVIGARSNNGAVLFYTGNAGTDGDWGASSNAERLRVTSAGLVGINSTAPTNALDVRGDIVAGGDASLSTRPAGIALQETGVIVASRSNASIFVGFDEGTDTATSSIRSTGEATFSNSITVGSEDVLRWGSTDSATIIGKEGTSTGYLTFSPNNEKVRINANGNIGIGTTNFSGRKIEVYTTQGSTTSKILELDRTAFSVNQFDTGWTDLDQTPNPVLAWNFKSGTGDMMYMSSGGNTPIADQMALVVSDGHGFKVGKSSYDGSEVDIATGSNEFFRINNDGHIQIGQTSTATPGFNSNTDVGAAFEVVGTGGVDGRALFLSRSSNAALFINANANTAVARFSRSGSQKGDITITTSAVAYNTTSDYRLKENVVGLTSAISRVKQLQPKRFNFIVEPGAVVDGFIAHEAQTVVPESVTGTHNEVEVWKESDELPDGVSVGDNKLDGEGNTIPVYQGIDQAKFVPLLTAALQEAITKIETLETKVAALEGS